LSLFIAVGLPVALLPANKRGELLCCHTKQNASLSTRYQRTVSSKRFHTQHSTQSLSSLPAISMAHCV